MQKFLIIQTAFLGDVILATPLISALAEKYPACEIDFLLRKGNESIIANNPNLRQVYTFDKKNKWKALFSLIKQFRSRKYDEIINLHRFGSSGLISVLSGAKNLTGFKKNPFSIFYQHKIIHQYKENWHEVDRNLCCIQHHGNFSSKKPSLFPSIQDDNAVEKYRKNNYICIFPASVWFTKQLPKEKWIELCNHFDSSIKILLLGSKSDFDLCEEIKAKTTHSNSENISGFFTLLQVASLVKTAKMNFVNDSGPMHIASAMNAPCTAFFCSTSTTFGFTPLSDLSFIFEKTPKPSCKPCGLHGFKACPKKHFMCGELNMQSVYEHIKKFL
ncbi:MAG: glycosyltransferase family 9 protein [Flavobacteriia bacterium]|nr:glycosyltransferase family 9 protein [Flavobacteriia bacterium]